MEGSGTNSIGWNRLQNADFEDYENEAKDPPRLRLHIFMLICISHDHTSPNPNTWTISPRLPDGLVFLAGSELCIASMPRRLH